ncbi:sigma-54 dependent transcriptional regulator [Bdellovibrio bacteriovorus]|uniref:sigma-54 interaction domain-containing protein n=1 Tax=Bdellovibrio bacteriovorus TaxID=959 RepID=UPI0021D12E01|nr:sigma-54 dependent transcriptional regulator [Bdellovibrio bacteriovorus]UXR64003.1 sigma-54 dependent transcriptional regulator [Bdellovibrio bacteriovorus]
MSTFSPIIGKSPRFLEVLDMARRVAASSANVLITGESGTGKEVIARLIHDLSARQKKTFVPINCSAIPEPLLESELFGYARGAFTGAHSARQGLFEEADGGTLFLDEIGDLDLHLQAKLLRVLQEKKVKRVGENHYRPLNLRIVSATHNDLEENVVERRFREDLYFRLKVVSIKMPPLRERADDILPLAHHFLDKFLQRYQMPEKKWGRDVDEFLVSRPWSGNVRELENSIERAVVLSPGPEISLKIFQEDIHEKDENLEPIFERLFQVQGRFLSLEELNQAYISFVLKTNRGAREKSSRDLGIDRKTLYRKLHSSLQ